jgi:hypothetical protein
MKAFIPRATLATVFALLLFTALRAQTTETAPANESATANADAEKKPLPDDIQKIIATGRDHNQAMAHLDYLTNRIGPRLTGSDNQINACLWARDTFEKFGLKNAQVNKWAEWPVGFNRGPWFGDMITPEKKGLEFETDAWTAGTKGKQRGPAILAPKNDDELERMKDKLAGAWILSPPAAPRGGGRAGRGGRGGGAANRAEGQTGGGPRLPQPGDRPRNESATPQSNERQSAESRPADSQSAATPTRVAQLAAGQPATTAQPDNAQPAATQPATEQAAADQPGQGRRGGRRGGGRRGAGFNDPFRQKLQAAYKEAGVLGTITRRNNDILVTGGRRPTTAAFLDNLPTTPQINMAASSFDAIMTHLDAKKPVTLEFDIRNHFKKGPVPIYNVLADIPGSEWPDQYVIVGGHIDSWDGATGATDNGTGVASAMEAARILMAAGVHPKRTIRFMLWSGEEQGILGSRAYVQANKELMPKISAVLVHDLGTQYLSSVSGLSYQLADLKEVFAPVMTLNPAFPFKVRSTDSLTSLGSDHRPFVTAGVPAYFWGQSGEGFNYWDSHHSQHDTFDKAVPEYQEHSSIVIALAAYNIANLDHMLPRQGDEAAGDE